MNTHLNLPILYPQKQLILNKINQYFTTSRIGYLKVPTGWGKTFLAKHLMKQYYEAGKVILFIVSQNNQLLKQTAYNNNTLLFPNSDILSSDYKQDTSKEILTKLKRRNRTVGYIVFASLQSILSERNKELRGILTQKTDLVVIDEIHNFIENRGNGFIKEINGNAKIFGMTATPFQGTLTKMKFVEDIHEDIQEIHSESLISCIDCGILSCLNYTIIYSKQDIIDIFDFSKGIEEITKHELLLDCSTIEKITNIVKRSQLAKEVYNTNINPFSKTLIFCSPAQKILNKQSEKVTSFHAKLTAKVFNNELSLSLSHFNNYTSTGHLKPTVYLSSDLPKKEKVEILEAFRKPFTPPYTLCTVGMLIEGFDFPDLKNLILLRPTLSMRLFEQQIGRVLRIPKDKNDTPQGNIFEVVDNTDCLYNIFDKQIFNSKISEQIQMLYPKVRIEKLLFEDDGYRKAIINFKSVKIDEVEYVGNSQFIQVKSSNQQLNHLKRLLDIIKAKTDGSLYSEKTSILSIASKVRIHNLQDIKDVLKLIDYTKKLREYAKRDDNLSSNCKKMKPRLFFELEQMLKLNLVSAIEKLFLDYNVEQAILKYIGCNKSIIEYKEECVKQGSGRDIQNIKTILSKELLKTGDNWSNYIKMYRAMQSYYQNWAKFFDS